HVLRIAVAVEIVEASLVRMRMLVRERVRGAKDRRNQRRNCIPKLQCRRHGSSVRRIIADREFRSVAGGRQRAPLLSLVGDIAIVSDLKMSLWEYHPNSSC